MIIELDGIPIHVSRKAIKNINLRIHPPEGLVKVSVPKRYTERLIRSTLEPKLPWIHEQRKKIKNKGSTELLSLETGSSVPFLGNNYLFVLEERNGPKQITLQEEIMCCFAPPNSSVIQREQILDSWYQQQMAALLPDLIHHWEQIVGVKISDWRIRKMKSRWGSCNTRTARICLNLNLIKKPQICLEYVLLHELIHLLEASHNQRFYAFMNQFMPQWRDYQNLLEGRCSK